MAQPPTWWRKSELEDAQELEPTDHLGPRIERLERAYDTEVMASMSLNIRSAALAVGSAIAILLLAQFSATWLDDSAWTLPDISDAVMQVLLPITVVALAGCILVTVSLLATGAFREDNRGKVYVPAEASPSARFSFSPSSAASTHAGVEFAFRALRIRLSAISSIAAASSGLRRTAWRSAAIARSSSSRLKCMTPT